MISVQNATVIQKVPTVLACDITDEEGYNMYITCHNSSSNCAKIFGMISTTESLTIEDTAIDLNILTSLTRLKYLRIINCSTVIKSTVLSSIPTLTKVWINCCTLDLDNLYSDSIKELYLDVCKVTNSDRPDFSGFTALESLRLSSINSAIPIIENCTQLKTVSISGMKKSDTLDSHNWSGLTLLEDLYISGCDLLETNSWDWIGQLISLTVLEISECKLRTTIPDSIGNLSRLIRLDLSHNRLKGSIPSSIGSIDTLQRIILSNNNLSGTVESLYNCISAHVIELDYNRNLTGSIVPLIYGLPYLRRLCVKDLAIEPLDLTDGHVRSALELKIHTGLVRSYSSRWSLSDVIEDWAICTYSRNELQDSDLLKNVTIV